ncbi:Inner membrane transport permease YhhJ [Gemmata obscuriglobus]|uniref:ABC transporter permease n=1 Tax=Gemmata obscuriglobus TaxID=114 RepID=A0A2Z3H3T0_9BACT|nr:ABC transporter permease [Gemmata obscuriglobus]AWM38982.1 ABC transporter permease [Gemmata obscuriglobus]QEG27998.1 Inner membrane transport permease YhhJ [Gemmata obscuriglobus]VTS05522.1 membrane protein : Putative ABC transporter (Permease protein) OS=Azospirillum brasilense Sp245 GN=AZOBR_p330096 PE=4 SV=1: ABC2_membrane_3 [Gemmata obscuriglobus UQM 2246]
MRAGTVWHLGVKELWSLARDPMLLGLIAFSFTVSVYAGATAQPETLNKAPIAVVDYDRSPLSERITAAFYPPQFLPPARITPDEMDARMDAGRDTFALVVPPDFQRDVLAGRRPAVQLNVDATRMSQAYTGSGYVETITSGEVRAFADRYRANPAPPVDMAVRARFNPELNKSWFGAVVKLIDNVNLLAIALAGAALIRERERGTIEHLLVMPVTPFEIMTGKVWSMGLVVLFACALSLRVVVQGALGVPVGGSRALFLCGVALHLFAATSIGIFMGTFARSMPQFGLLLMMVVLPLQMLSGGVTPRESMPGWVQTVMLAAPTTHFVALSQGILYRGAGLSVVWPQFLALALIGTTFFGVTLARFRKVIGTMA